MQSSYIFIFIFRGGSTDKEKPSACSKLQVGVAPAGDLQSAAGDWEGVIVMNVWPQYKLHVLGNRGITFLLWKPVWIFMFDLLIGTDVCLIFYNFD